MPTPAESQKISLKELRRACSSCSLAELCLPLGFDADDLRELERIVQPSAPIESGEHLFRLGDQFAALYAVRSGHLKTYIVDDNGREQVLGFHLPGELIGLDAIYPEKHQCNAMALDTATVCRVEFSQISHLATQVPGLQAQMFRIMSKNIGESYGLAGDYTAEERLAAFLVGLSARLRLRGYSATRFNLVMPRRDIANYLRLATETVSRVFKRFQEEGLIRVDRREIELTDRDRLEDLARCLPK